MVWLYFFQFCKIHTQPFFTDLALKLHLNELGILLHLAFQDGTSTKQIMKYFIAWLVLLLLGAAGIGCCAGGVFCEGAGVTFFAGGEDGGTVGDEYEPGRGVHFGGVELPGLDWPLP